MASSGMWRRVHLVKTDVSKERVASIVLGTANVFHSALFISTRMMMVTCTSETSVLTRATLCNSPEGVILHITILEEFYICDIMPWNPLISNGSPQGTGCLRPHYWRLKQLRNSCVPQLDPPCGLVVSSWRLTQRFRVLFPELQDFLSSSGSGTGSTQTLWG
jgi:hypothetical protein